MLNMSRAHELVMLRHDKDFPGDVMPTNRRMFWKVRATPASRAMRKHSIRSELKFPAVAVQASACPSLGR